MLRWQAVIVLLALPLVACSRKERLVGLWEQCEDSACNQVLGKAFFFTDDGLTYVVTEGSDAFDVPKGQYCRTTRPNSTYEVQEREIVLVFPDRTTKRFSFTVEEQFLTMEGAGHYGETLRFRRATNSGELPPRCSN